MDPILFFASLVCFLVATFSVPTGRINMVALGLVFYVATYLI